MHISDGVLGLPVVIGSSAAAAGLLAYSIKGVKEQELPKIALMSAVFFTGSFIHFNIGASSVHLMLSGIIGLVLGRRTPIAVSAALLLQMLGFQFGGLSSYGANVFDVAVPTMLLSYFAKPFLGKSKKTDFICGFLCGGISVILTVVFVSFMLIESNLRFGFGPFSAVTGLMLGHIPLALIEAVVTGFAVRMIVQIRPEILDIRKEVRP